MKLIQLIISVIFSIELLASPYEDFANQTFRKLPNSLTINITPSTYPLDWSTSRGLIYSLIKNKYLPSKSTSEIGHVNNEINCSINGVRTRYFIGQSVKDLLQFRKYISQGHGLAILNQPKNMYHNIPLLTVKGQLDKYEEQVEKFDLQLSRNRFAVLSIKISANQCKKLLEFSKEYESRTKTTKSAGNNYGFGADPKSFEGAGCATLTQGLLEIAGLETIASIMNQRVYASSDIVGSPKSGHKVSLLGLIIKTHSLSTESADKLIFDFPDPQRLYDEVTGFKSLEAYKNSIIKKEPISGTKGSYLLLDYTDI